jgi:hypothetical protein
MTIIKYSDGSEVDLIFDEKLHKYKVGDDVIPSVTKIIDGIVPVYLIQWAANVGADWFKENAERGWDLNNSDDVLAIADGISNAHKNISGRAKDIGKTVHNYIQEVINWSLAAYEEGFVGGMPELPEDEQAVNSIKAFGKWGAENDVEWISAEEKIYSKEYKYAGTVDAVALVDGELSVIDFKTSKQIYKSYKLQVYAYKQAIEEVYGQEVKRCFILRFDKTNGKFQAKEIKDNYLPAFLKGLDFLNEYKRRR